MVYSVCSNWGVITEQDILFWCRFTVIVGAVVCVWVIIDALNRYYGVGKAVLAFALEMLEIIVTAPSRFVGRIKFRST